MAIRIHDEIKRPIAARPRPHLRLSPQSHIDLETGMQHV
jgi:hypothetical protein